MATSKNITVTIQNQNNATSPVAVNFVTDPIVSDGVLKVDYRTTNPGVFTAGTPMESTPSNPDNDVD